MVFKNPLNALKRVTSKISYSTKVKIVIAFSSLLSISAILYIITLQKPFLESIKRQTILVNYYHAWTLLATHLEQSTPQKNNSSEELSLALLNFRESQKIFVEYLTNNSPTVALRMETLDATIDYLRIAIQMKIFPSNEINAQLAVLNDNIIYEASKQLSDSLGSDIPSYLIANLLFHPIALTQDMSLLLPTLSFALDIIHNDLLPYPPGKILDDVHQWESAPLSQALNKQLIFQKDLSETLKALLENQLSILQFRERTSLLCVLAGLLIVLTVYSTRVMRTPLADLRFAAQELAKGNLWQRAAIDSQDEVAKMCLGFNRMVSLLEKAVSSTSVVSNKLTETIFTIVNSSRSFEKNVSDQEKTIAKIALNTMGVTQTAKEVVQALADALEAATTTHAFAISAQGSIKTIEIALRRTATASQQIVETLSHLEEKVSSLTVIITTIVNVADEANLLAINTALISSRSADYRHSGFGVIAGKISDLASKIAFVMLKMEDSVRTILKALSMAGSRINHISTQMHSHGQAAAKLVDRFREMTRAATAQMEACVRMRTAIEQQQSSAEQIHDTITLLSQGSKITTRSVRNLYSQIQYLSEASSNLQIIFDRFHLQP